MDEKIKQPDDEIDLMEILFVIWRWKFVIVSIVVLFTTTVVIFLLFTPNVYKCRMTIRPAALLNNGSIQKNIVESKEIISTIKSNDLKKKIASSQKILKKDLYRGKLTFNTRSIPRTDFIEVEYFCYNPDSGVKILNILIEYLNEYFKPELNNVIEEKMVLISDIDRKISVYKHQIKSGLLDKEFQLNFILGEISYLEKMNADLEKEVAKIEQQIRNLEKQTKSIEQKHRDIPDNKLNFTNALYLEAKLDRIQGMEYFLNMSLFKKQNIIGLNRMKLKNLLDQKRKQIEKYSLEKDRIEFSIAGLENEKESIQKDIHGSKYTIDTVNTPSYLSNPVKPQKKLIILLSAIISFFIATFCVFLFEYFRKYKENRLSKISQ